MLYHDWYLLTSPKEFEIRFVSRASLGPLGFLFRFGSQGVHVESLIGPSLWTDTDIETKPKGHRNGTHAAFAKKKPKNRQSPTIYTSGPETLVTGRPG